MPAPGGITACSRALDHPMHARAQDPGQRLAPSLEALVAFAARHPRRAMVPGHKGGLAADRGLRAALGAAALALDVPTLIEGIDAGVGAGAPPVRGRAPAGCRRLGRATDVVSHQRRVAGQRGGLPGHRPARRARRRAAHRPRQHDRRDGPRGSAPRLRRGRGRCRTGGRALRPALHPGRGAGRHPRRGRGDRRLADLLRRRGRRPRPGARRPRPRRAAGRRRGRARTWPSAARCPSTRSAAGADLVVSSTHKHAGSLTQSAMLHPGLGTHFDEERDRPRPAAGLLDEPEQPVARLAGRGAPPRGAQWGRAARAGSQRARRRCAPASAPSAASRSSTSASSDPSGIAAIDPLRVCADVRAAAVSGH